MWLIDTNTLRLQCVPDPSKFCYAILSHTWEEEEVSFCQFQHLDSARLMKGFGKIEKTCELARDRALQYAWIDTCCIDKTNNVELTEAINSMFQWYNKSAVCFVYLSDLGSSGSDEPVLAGEWYTREHLGQCRWFTRGWTLQELIAPEKVWFFNERWQKVATKGAITTTLSKITGIDMHVLQFLPPSGLRQIPVARKMAWAANRQTTRPEDLAYCLLGLFDIAMPLIYGEGNRAFLRLQEEIAKEINDLSLFAWKWDKNSNSQALEEPVPLFSGIFAPSPNEFGHCDKICLLPRTARLDKEFTITNKGVRIEAALAISADNDFVLPLECYDGNTQTKENWIGLFLALTHEGYFRSQSHRLFYNTEVGYWRNEMSLVYIQKRLCTDISRWLLHDSMTGIGIYRSLLEPKGPYQVVSAGPPALWDASKGCFLAIVNFPLTLYLHVRHTGPEFEFILFIFVRGPKIITYDVRSPHDEGWEQLLALVSPVSEMPHDYKVASMLKVSDSLTRHTKQRIIRFRLSHTAARLTIIPPAPLEVQSDRSTFSPFMFVSTIL